MNKENLSELLLAIQKHKNLVLIGFFAFFTFGFFVLSGLHANQAQAAVQYYDSGAFSSGTGAITPAFPASTSAGYVCLLAVESENQAITLSSAQGFAEVTSYSPQSAGTAGVSPASRLALFWKRLAGGDTAPTVADSGDHTTGQIHCFSGVTSSGNPWDIGAGGNDSAANDTSAVIPGATTTVDNTMVVLITSTSNNGNSTANCGTPTNASLTSLTEWKDQSSTSGLGGGHCMITGLKASAGTYSDTTLTLASTSYKGAISLALKPETITISGTCMAYDRVTPCSDTAGTLKVAVAGSLISASLADENGPSNDGSWTITGIDKPSIGFSLEVFLDGAPTNADKAVAIFVYGGSGNISGIKLYKEHITIGSDQNTDSSPLDFQYDYTSDTDILFKTSVTNTTCNGVANFTGFCSDAGGVSSQEVLYIDSGDTFSPADGTNINTENMEIAGTLAGASSQSIYVTGSWLDTGTFTPGTNTIIFASTGTGETITTTGSTFYNLTFNGSGGGWTLQDSTTVSGLLTLTAGTLNGGNVNLNLTAAVATPFVISGGTFNSGTGLVVYAGINAGGNVNVTATTYYDLMIDYQGTSETYQLTGNTTVTNDLNIYGRLDGVTGQNYILTIGKNFYVDLAGVGTFLPGTGTVTFNDSGKTSVVSGSYTFYNVTVTTAGKNVDFTAGTTTTINGLLTVTGTNGNNVVFDSTAASVWTINHQGTESITYLTVNWGACHASSTAITMGTGSTKDGNSGTCWEAPASAITISGTVYLSDSTTVDGTGYTLQISNGGGITTSTTSDGSGVFSFTNYGPPTAGNVLTIWIDGGVAFGTTILKYGSLCTGTPDCTGLKVVRNQVRLYSKNSTSLTYDDLNDCDEDDGGLGCGTTNIGFNVDNATNAITIADGRSLYITGGFDGGGATFAPGAPLTTSVSTDGTDTNVDGDICISCEEGGGGTLSMGTNALSIGGDIYALGVFAKSTGQTTTFTATATGHGANICYSPWENVIFNGTGGGWEFGTCGGSDAVIDGDLTVTAGTLSGTLNTTVSGGDVTGNGTINLTGGTFTVSGAGSFGGNTAWDFNNLTFSGGSQTTTGTGTGSVTTAATLTIGSTHTLNGGGKTWILSATGTPFVATGVFTASTSTVSYTGGAATTYITSSSNGGTSITYYKLEANPNSSTAQVLGTASGHTITVSNNFRVGNGTNTGGATGATYNPTITVGGQLLIYGSATYTTGTGTLTFTSSIQPLYRTGGSATFTATSGNTVVFTSTTGGSELWSFPMTGTSSFYNLTIDGDGGGDNFTANQDIDVVNDLTVSAGDNFIGTTNITVNGVVGGTGIINFSGGTFTHSTTTSKNFGDSGNWTFNNLTLSGASGTTQANGSGSITVNGTLEIGTSHTLGAGGKTWILNGTSGTPFLKNGTLDVSSGTSTFSFRDTGGATIPLATYDNLDFAPTASTNSYEPEGSMIVNNDLTIGGAGVAIVDLNTNGAEMDVAGSVTIGAGDTLSIVGTSTAMAVGGSWTNSGTFTNNNGTVTFDATTTGKTITSGSGSFSTIVFAGAGGEWTLQDNLDVAGVLTISNGNLNASSRTITLAGGTPFVKTGGTFTQGTSTVLYSNNGAATTVLALNGASTTDAYYNLQLGVSGSNPIPTTYTMAGSTTVNNIVEIGATNFCDATDTLALGSTTLILNGSGTPLDINACGTLDAGTSSVRYQSASGVTALSTTVMTGSNAFYGLWINGTGTFTSGVDVTVNDSLAVQSGTLAGAPTFTVNGAAVGNGIINFTGGTFTQNYTSGATSFGGNSDWNFYDLTLTGSGGTTSASGSGAINVSDILTVGTGHTLDAGSKTWTLSGTGTPFSNSGTFTASTSTFNYTGAGATNIAATTYNNLGVKPGANAATHTLATGAFTVGGTLTLGNGTNTGAVVTAATNNNIIDVNGTANPAVDIKANTTFVAPASASFTVAGGWANAGTFTHSSGAVTFDATSTGKTIQSNGNSFNNIIFNGTGGGWSPSDAMVLAGDMTLTAGTLSGTQNVTVNGGDVAGNGDINITGGTFLIDGTGNVGGTTAWDFNSLTFGDGTGTATSTASGAGSVAVSGALTIAANQTLNAGSKAWTLSATGTPFVVNGTFTPASSTMQYTGTTANIAAATYNDLTLGGTGTYTMPASNSTFNGDFVITSGATVTKGAGTLVFASAIGQTITDNNATKQDLGALQSSSGIGSGVNVASQANGGVVTASSTINASYPETATNDGYRFAGGVAPAWGAGGGWNDNTSGAWPDTLDITFNNTYTINEIDVFTVPDSLSTGSNPTLADTFSSYGITEFAIQYWNGSDWTTIDSVTSNNKVWRQFTFSPVSTNKIRLSISNGNGYSRLLELEAWSSSATGLTMGSSIKATSLTIDSGKGFDVNGANTLTLTGNGASVLVDNGGTFTASTGTVNFESAATTGTTVPALTYYNLGLNKASNTFTASGAMTVGNNFTISAGTFVAPSGNLTVVNDFTNNDTFTHNSGTVLISPAADDSVLIGGSSNTTFNNLTNTTSRTTMQFANGRTYAIDGTWTVTGASGRPIWIQSDSAGVQWFVDVNGTATISYVNVKDSGCSSSADISTATKVFNQGNNGTCWLFILRGSGTGASGGGAGSGGAGVGGGSQGGGGASSQATATATVSAGAVQSVQVTNGGSGYSLAPLVCFADSGSANETGATATAIVASGAVQSIVVNSGGSGYTATTLVTIGAPGTSGGTCSSGSGGGGSGGGGGGSP